MKKSRGFTVVELIVIIVVIGILAGIVAVAWPNYMKSVHDGERKSDLEQLAAALDVYALQKNDHMGVGSGCGKNGDGNGWVSFVGTVDGDTYPKSIVKCLQDIEALPGEPFNDPSGCTTIAAGACSVPVRAYMKATCQQVSGQEVTYLFAHLETEPRKDSEIDGLCNGTVAGFDGSAKNWGSLYGMNYYVEVD